MPSTEFVDFVLDQLADLNDIRAQRMFAGFGLYSRDVFFGIVYQDILYFKVNDHSRRDYVTAGMPPFTPYKHRSVTLQYYQVPAEVVEDADELCQWARRAIQAAEETKKPNRKIRTSRRS
jgi:DNA transformation protein and related proteins